MISFSRVKETVIEGGFRVAKVFQFGAKTATVASAFGDDSNPIKDMIAIYANTSEVGDKVIVGYLNQNHIAAIGEKRIFSLKPNGDLSFAIHLKNDETCEIGGNADNAVRYSKLEEAFNELKNDLNTLIGLYNTHSHAANGTPTASTAEASVANIVPSRVDSVKLP